MMEITGTRGVGVPPIVSALDVEYQKKDRLIRTVDASACDFVCKKHSADGGYFIVYTLKYERAGKDAGAKAEYAVDVVDKREVEESFARLEKERNAIHRTRG